MAKQTQSMEKKTLNAPDQVRTFDSAGSSWQRSVRLRLAGPVSSLGGDGLSRLNRL